MSLLQLPLITTTVNLESDRTKGLFKLPPELIHTILESFESVFDALALVMTNRMLYTLGFSYVHRHFVASAAPCTGRRVICLSNRSRDDDLPDAVTSEDLRKAQIWKEGQPSISDSEPCSYRYYAYNTFRPITSVILRTGVYNLVKRQWPGDNSWRSKPWYDALKKIIVIEESGEEGILCNLTKREYVDGIGAVAIIRAYGILYDMSYLLAAILRCRILWSSDEDVGLFFNPGSIHRGAWAGDRFEITTEDRLDYLIEEAHQEWKDVTEEVMGEVLRAYMAFEWLSESELGIISTPAQ